MKLNVEFKCPHCLQEQCHTIGVTAFKVVECHHCEKVIDLKLSNTAKWGSEVLALLPKRSCEICHHEFLSKEWMSDSFKEACPQCGWMDDHWNLNRQP